MNKMRILQWLLLLSLVSVMLSCKNKYNIPEAKMEAILVEFHMADALVSTQGLVMDSTKYYEPILNKYGYTLADFRKATVQYMNSPLVFNKLYERVVAQLKVRQAELTPPPPVVPISDSTSRALLPNEIPQHESLYPYWHYEISLAGDTVRICW